MGRIADYIHFEKDPFYFLILRNYGQAIETDFRFGIMIEK